MIIVSLALPRSALAGTVFSDGFTDADGVSLATHNPLIDILEGSGTIQSNQLSISPVSFFAPPSFSLTDQCTSMDLLFPIFNRISLYARSPMNDTALSYSTNFDNKFNISLNTYDVFINYGGPSGTVNIVGQRTQVDPGWHNVKFCVIGSQLTIYVDNTALTSGSDSHTAAGFGMWRFANNVDPATATDPPYTADNFLLEAPNVNESLTVSSPSNATLDEGGTYAASGSYLDTTAGASSWTASVDYGDGSGLQALALSGSNFNLSHVYGDNGKHYVIVTVEDDQGQSGVVAARVTVNNVSPSVGTITAPSSPVQVNTSVSASASFTDPGVLDTHTASWDWGDGNTTVGTVTESNGSGSVSNTHTFAAAGVYAITLTVTDKDSGVGTKQFKYVVVYDPSAGWVSGSKDYTSPAGAVTGNSGATGTASFGFQVKYANGSMVPSGKNVVLSFPTGNINFTSTSYEWLVVNGSKAIFKADGTLNGTAGYTVLVSAIDTGNGNPSGLVRFQIKDSSSNVFYDTQPGAGDNEDPTISVTKGQIAVH